MHNLQDARGIITYCSIFFKPIFLSLVASLFEEKATSLIIPGLKNIHQGTTKIDRYRYSNSSSICKSQLYQIVPYTASCRRNCLVLAKYPCECYVYPFHLSAAECNDIFPPRVVSCLHCSDMYDTVHALVFVTKIGRILDTFVFAGEKNMNFQ